MTGLPSQGAKTAIGPATMLPLVRHISGRMTPVLARLPVTANQITVAALGAQLYWLSLLLAKARNYRV